MRLVDLLRGKSPSTAPQVPVTWVASDAGIAFGPSINSAQTAAWASGSAPGAHANSILEELVIEGVAERSGDIVILEWARLYEIAGSRSWNGAVAALELPEQIEIAPKLRSRGTLVDLGFAVELGRG
jgi:hypothetical protein